MPAQRPSRAHSATRGCRRRAAGDQQGPQHQPVRAQRGVADPRQQRRHQHEQHAAEDLERRTRGGARHEPRAERTLEREAQQPPQADVLEVRRQPRRPRLEQIRGQRNRIGQPDRRAERRVVAGDRPRRPVPRLDAEVVPAEVVRHPVELHQPLDAGRIEQRRAGHPAQERGAAQPAADHAGPRRRRHDAHVAEGGTTADRIAASGRDRLERRLRITQRRAAMVADVLQHEWDPRLADLMAADDARAAERIATFAARNIEPAVRAATTAHLSGLPAADRAEVAAACRDRLLGFLRAVHRGDRTVPVADLDAFAATCADDACRDYLRRTRASRARLGNRVRLLCTRGTGVVMWRTPEGQLVAGLPAWTQRDPLDTALSVARSAQDVVGQCACRGRRLRARAHRVARVDQGRWPAADGRAGGARRRAHRHAGSRHPARRQPRRRRARAGRAHAEPERRPPAHRPPLPRPGVAGMSRHAALHAHRGAAQPARSVRRRRCCRCSTPPG